jgi:hypothetical protein
MLGFCEAPFGGYESITIVVELRFTSIVANVT